MCDVPRNGPPVDCAETERKCPEMRGSSGMLRQTNNGYLDRTPIRPSVNRSSISIPPSLHPSVHPSTHTSTHPPSPIRYVNRRSSIYRIHQSIHPSIELSTQHARSATCTSPSSVLRLSSSRKCVSHLHFPTPRYSTDTQRNAQFLIPALKGEEERIDTAHSTVNSPYPLH